MSFFEIGIVLVVVIVVFVYIGVYILIVLGLVFFVFILLMWDNFDLVVNLLKIVIGDSVMEYIFVIVLLFIFMGLIVLKVGLGVDIY